MKHKQVRMRDKVKRDKFETKSRAAVKLMKRAANEQDWSKLVYNMQYAEDAR